MARLLLFLAFLQLALCAVLQLGPNGEDGLGPDEGYMQMALHHAQIKSPSRKRQGGSPVYTEDLSSAYCVNVTFGSNNQTIPLLLDTGSPVTWVNPDCFAIPDNCTHTKAKCFSQPRYDPLASTTAKMQEKIFNNTYGTGSVLATYFTDDIRIGSVVANDALFGVAGASSNFEAEIFGIGARPKGYPPTVIDTLASQGKIGSFAYSMDIKSVNETGSLVLGGIDTKKYKHLTKVPSHNMTLPNKTHVEFDPSIWRENKTSLPVIFDMGTPTNLLPNNLYFAIGELYPDAIPYRHPLGFTAYKVPCDAPLGTFDYTFGSYTIKVSFLDSLWKDPADGHCTFGFTLGPQDEGAIPYILADTFMRGAYMVFDMDNDEIWIGESADCGSKVVPIGKGKDAVPIVPGCEAKHEPEPTKSGYASLPTSMASNEDSVEEVHGIIA